MSPPTHKLCMIPGPCEFQDNVLQAMSTPALSHVSPAFIKTFGEALTMLRDIFLCKDGQPFIVAGAGTLGWDMMVCNLIEPNDEVLVVNAGYFGDRFMDCLQCFGIKGTDNLVPPGERHSIEMIEKAIKDAPKPFKLVHITQVDTSTGVLSDVQGIADCFRRLSPETVVAVDGVCSVGAEELRMDEWGVDVAMTGSQKALGTPSGLCIMMASEKAMNVYKTRKAPIMNFYANWNKWVPILQAYEKGTPSYFSTPAVNNIVALHASLTNILADGMEKRFADHLESSRKVKQILTSIGLKLVPVSLEGAANTMTACYYPDGVDAKAFLKAVNEKGVVLAGGLHKVIGPKYFRIGHMAYSAVTHKQDLDVTCAAIKDSLIECGFKC